MARRTMSMAIMKFDRTQALLSRAVDVPDVLVSQAHPRVAVEGFVNGIYDAAEIPVARYFFLKAHGEPVTAIPVFTDRIFVQQYAFTRPDSGIKSPADLRGRKVMIPGYYLTSSIWHRGLLKDNFGVEPHEVEWVTFYPERDPRMSPPEGVKVTHVPAERMGIRLLLDGTVDALMLETTGPMEGDEPDRIVPVYQNVNEVQREWYRQTHFHPGVHIIGVRQSAVDERPEFLEELCHAFDKARALTYKVLQNERQTALPMMRSYLNDSRALFGDDPWPYGYDKIHDEVAQALSYAYDQGLTKSLQTPEQLFEKAARDFRFKSRMAYGSDPFIYPMP